MALLDVLERKFGRFAVPNLTRILIAFNGLVYVLYKLNPAFLSVLDLVPERVLAGEVWRLGTYLFIPQIGGFLPDWLGIILYLWSLWFIGEGLENAWGPFKLNVYYLIGMIGTTIAAFFFGSAFSNVMLNTSLFFAFARFYPETMIYIFYILPVKVRWVAWGSGAFLLLGLVTGTNAYRMALLSALANYLVFFGSAIIHEARHRKDVTDRRRRFEAAAIPADVALHECAVCHETELTNANLDFRVSRDGNEYCRAHLPSVPS